MTVLLVDDEYLVRSLIRNSIDWDALGVSKVVEAGSSAEALDIVRNQRIDVASLDINMPGENGISLGEHLKVRQPGIQIMMCTGHREIAFAQQAIQLGVAAYVLKPLNEDEYQTALAKCIGAATMNKVSTPESHAESVDVTPPGSGTIAYVRVLQGALDERTVEAYRSEYARILKTWGDVVAVFYPEEHPTVHDVRRMMAALRSNADYQTAALMCGTDGQSAIPMNDPSLDRSFFFDAGRLENLDTADSGTKTRREATTEIVRLRSGLEVALQAGDSRSIAVLLDQLSALGAAGDCSIYRFKGTAIDLIAARMEWLHGRDDGAAVPDHEIVSRIADARSADEVRGLVRGVLAAAPRVPNRDDERASRLVQMGIDEICRRYADPQLGLADIADHLGMSTSYFSTLFKRRTGQGYQEFLESVRLKQAADLLASDPRLTISEIAEQCGYADPFYFSRRFKGRYGVSPRRARRNVVSDP